jgi:predicted ATPase
MITLNKISLEGYKSIKNCRDLSLGKLNVLIGANGSGKSNFLSFFKLLNFEMTGALQEFIGRSGGANSLLHFGAKVTPHISAELTMVSDTGENQYRMRLAHASPDTLIFTEEAILYYPDVAIAPPNARFLGAGHRESALLSPALAEERTAKFFKRVLPRFRFYQFHDTSDRSHFRARADLETDRYLYADGGNIAAYLRALREDQAASYQRIVETVRLVFPFFRDFVLEPENGGGYVLLRWKATGAAEYEFGPHQISDGTLRFIALATLLLQPPDRLPSLIIIDEPELGLHPYAIKILTSLLEEVSDQAQVLVATQSVSLIDQVPPEDVIVANLEEGITTLQRLDPEKLSDWLKDYSLSQMWESNLFGGRP